MASSNTARKAGVQQTPREDFPLAERPGYMFHKAALLLYEDVERALESTGMRARYFFVLASLAGGPRLSQQDISRLLNLDPTTVVSVIDEMERNRHVERQRDPADRRRYHLFLTDDGREQLAKAETIVTDAETAFFATLEKAELGAMHGMLRRLLAGRWPASVCED
ncbi:MarR family transcriptional regulator [Kineosporia sp. J2-2]|uniref:MarR family transcriptional regulator n=1 Tax=Kineosporia corallincola TaxID=2835133 RepID=A0ABS5TQY3_9ACTN|nr:MarR family transcriptional regulator [Kineosporia corallincola]MBT0772828.1 MarR family transcriptional regulator [Kineosporia corallincola]